MTRDEWIATALRYAAAGFKTFPLRPDGKEPAGWIPEGAHGYQGAVLAYEPQLSSWVKACTAGLPNLGLALGTDYIAIDLDRKTIDGVEVDGETWLLSALEQRGMELPSPTLEQRTANGGSHLIYRLPPSVTVKSAVGILPGVDIRASDGYIAVEPSVLKGDKVYTFTNFGTEPLLLPQEVLNVLESLRTERRSRSTSSSSSRAQGDSASNNPRGKEPIDAYVARVMTEGFRLGERDACFLYLARDLHWSNTSEWTALEIVEEVWRNTDQSADDVYELRTAQEKVARTYSDSRLTSAPDMPTEAELAWVTSIKKQSAERDNIAEAEEARRLEQAGVETFKNTAADLGVVRISDVQPEKVTWLWKNWIPCGKLSLIAGNPEAGKSTVMLELASTLSTGRPWPDGTRPQNPETVLLMTAEDGLADTVRPRIDAAGGDTSRFIVWETVTRVDPKTNEPVLSPPVFPDDVDKLRSLIYRDNPRLVIIDVLNAYLSGKIDSYRDADIRRVLMPLAKIAEETGAAIIGIVHLNKGSSTSVLNRINGSMGYGGTARVVLLAGSDPEDETGAARTLIVSKSNIGAKPAPLAYHISSYETELHSCGKIEWDGESELTAANLLTETHVPQNAAQANVQWLRDRFQESNGELDVSRLVERFTRETGRSQRTLQRLGAELGVQKVRIGFGNASHGVWVYPPRPAAEGETA